MFSIEHYQQSKSEGIRSIIAAFLLFTIFVQFAVYQGADQSSLFLYHLLLPVCFFIFRNPYWFSKHLAWYYAFFAVSTASTLAAGFRTGFSIRFVLIGIAAMAFLVGMGIAITCRPEHIRLYFGRVFILVWIVVIIRTLFYAPLYLSALLGNRRAVESVWFICSGGWNLESTYLAFIGLFVTGTGMAWWALGFSGVFSLMYQSRTGILLTALIGSFETYIRRRTQAVFRIGIVALIGVVLLAAYVLLADFSKSPIERFVNIQQEVDYGERGAGRLGLYQAALDALPDNYWGYGIGNVVSYLEENKGYSFRENNLHNIYLAILLEGGVQTFILYFFLVLRLIYLNIQCRFENPYGRVAAGYLFAGLFQFLGYDVIGWLFFGLFEGDLIRQRIMARSHER